MTKQDHEKDEPTQAPVLVQDLTALELLEAAAEKMDRRGGTRAKTYHLAANEVRELIARLEALT